MYGSPRVQTISGKTQDGIPDYNTLSVAQQKNAEQSVIEKPVYQPTGLGTAYNPPTTTAVSIGALSGIMPLFSKRLVYELPAEAPEVIVVPQTYSNLIHNAANPGVTPSLSVGQLTAPSLSTRD